ncbi:XRE family transcriptional regulator [Streptomyces sp. CoH27]|uniref:XRE family transcriptional regulator n=1 Tax=Streptomyces sp. CoH27 TaxID=2875763 RepID=UPI001CD4D20B|nr:XRE family transcriptional regulator [Streptomyces sp. CoH27]
MTRATRTEQPPAGRTAGRRGRKPGPISETAGRTHRAWLEPVRDAVFSRGLTLDDVADRSGFSKTRISELLRGNGYYPAWEITFSVIRTLGLPVQPMRRLWSAAAREAGKDPGWIRQCLQQVACEPETPPLPYQAFTESVRAAYASYARAFLQTDDRARSAVAETFDVLWLSWGTATGEENLRRHAWRLLRARVLAGAARRDGHPDLRPAVFSTGEVHESVPGHFVVLPDLVDLFDAIARLPLDQMDVVVLARLCGLDLAETIPYVTGQTPAFCRSLAHLLHSFWTETAR